ncbi:MAG: flagellar biosynthesis repressor FlbT [Hyphomonas sp.]|uniref:flagellar biosynthesis repressor FlbT n=1 Tax=Hyphomonas sp. TaxID=87 RepID=UPI0017FCDFB8|nr:flagellar biosynthesis repressor FlbT [Hyphomonas sp.]MBA3067887.1 flagellar biosynthesis repressor FlbT [Hyphomonas sp.]MBU3921598.1 flagellar biosynthesis repressor FlbT [Alphaproteobacteria bacterium]MBU4062443.1 flagellar biosynthesis repressor FlbT [Alphaproteobacteria bacterium]MBU4165948.1 flagellar biosynthesis repressor FlbT [Alphaproteobacteria bacterium]
MSGLVLKIAPGERFIVNGALLENGDKPARIRISEANVRVLRCRDAMRPEEVDTPVKRIYYAIQLLITGDLDVVDATPAIDAECCELLDIFRPIDADLIPALRSMLSRGNHYSALCHLRQVLAIEAQLLARRGLASKVA